MTEELRDYCREALAQADDNSLPPGNDDPRLDQQITPPKPELVINAGDLPSTAETLRDLLANSGELFDRGGLPVRVVPSADGGPPLARPITKHNVVMIAHRHCRPVKADTAITLPDRVAQMYLDMVGDWKLRPLAGVTTAPLLSAAGHVRVADSYDPVSTLWCHGVPRLELREDPSRAEAEAALRLLRETFRTFPFADEVTRCWDGLLGVDSIDIAKPAGQNESAFLVLLMTAICRASLPLAPAAIFTAPAVSGAGSGKGLLVRSICAIAFGTPPRACPPGNDRHEFDKRLIAELIEAYPVVFMDNVNGQALRSQTLASAITERPARGRVLGESRMVMLNSAAFIAITGNGLTVAEDLARRFIQCELDAQCEDPESRPFAKGFLEGIIERRNEFLTAALTIWRWGRRNAPHLKRGKPLGSFEVWAEWCRDPLLTLGCCDPVERIKTLKANDPHRQHIGELFHTWWDHHGSTPVRASDLHATVKEVADPQERGRQFVTGFLGNLAGTRAAGFVLTRQKSEARWSVTTYALKKIKPAEHATPSAGNGTEHGGHRGHRSDSAPPTAPMSPMAPMPYEVGASEVECVKACAQCGAASEPLFRTENGPRPVWLHQECRRFWRPDRPAQEQTHRIEGPHVSSEHEQAAE